MGHPEFRAAGLKTIFIGGDGSTLTKALQQALEALDEEVRSIPYDLDGGDLDERWGFAEIWPLCDWSRLCTGSMLWIVSSRYTNGDHLMPLLQISLLRWLRNGEPNCMAVVALNQGMGGMPALLRRGFKVAPWKLVKIIECLGCNPYPSKIEGSLETNLITLYYWAGVDLLIHRIKNAELFNCVALARDLDLIKALFTRLLHDFIRVGDSDAAALCSRSLEFVCSTERQYKDLRQDWENLYYKRQGEEWRIQALRWFAEGSLSA